MKPVPKTRVTVLAAASIVIALVSLLVLPPPIRGLGILVGFGAQGAICVFGGFEMASRRLAIAFGVYMLVCGVKFGAEFSDFPRPRSFTSVSTLCLLLSVAWLIVESKRVKGTDGVVR